LFYLNNRLDADQNQNSIVSCARYYVNLYLSTAIHLEDTKCRRGRRKLGAEDHHQNIVEEGM